MHALQKLSVYLADYIQEEMTRQEPINAETIRDALNAFEGGASETGKYYNIFITERK